MATVPALVLVRQQIRSMGACTVVYKTNPWTCFVGLLWFLNRNRKPWFWTTPKQGQNRNFLAAN